MMTTYKDIATWALAGLAIIISVFAASLSCLTRQDVRDLGHLDIKPKLAFKTAFKTDRSPTHFRVRNVGAVPATQIRIQGQIARYFEETNKVQAEFGGSGLEWKIEKLRPQQDTAVLFDEAEMQTSFDPRLPPEHHVFIMRLRYRRPSDLTAYVEQVYYFLNPDGRWCDEHDNSLADSLYLPIKKAAFAWPPSDVPLFWDRSHELHPVAADDHQ